jgi:hypothetical protein
MSRLARSPSAGVAARIALAALVLAPLGGALAATSSTSRSQDFSGDPRWESHNSRPDARSSNPPVACQRVHEDFGVEAGGRRVNPGAPAGEVGGRFVRSSIRAFVARPLRRPRSLQAPFRLQGSFLVAGDPSGGTIYVGLFDATHSIGTRVPSSVFLRLNGVRGGAVATVDVTSAHRLAAGSRYKSPAGEVVRLGLGRRYAFELTYRRAGAAGEVSLTIGDLAPMVVPVPAAVVADGARMNRFGLLPGQTNGGRMRAYFDDLGIDGSVSTFSDGSDGWRSHASHATRTDCAVHNRQDFGWDRGARALGGQIWRTDARRLPDARAWYADRLPRPLRLDGPFTASGTLLLRRADTDSGFVLGWFDSRPRAVHTAKSPLRGVLGVLVAGSSAIGDEVRPLAASAGGDERRPSDGLRIVLNRTYRFTLRYSVGDAGGSLALTLDGRRSLALDVPARFRAAATSFDRFGVRNVTRGGHRQVFRIDDLRYTTRR